MGQNTLMFEVGLQRAKDKYQEIYDEVMKLIEMGGSTIKLKVQLDKASDVQDLVKQLSSLGDGTLLKPLLDRINKLMTQLDTLGVDGSRSIQRLRDQYKEASDAVGSYYKTVENYEKQINKLNNGYVKTQLEDKLKAYKSTYNIDELLDRQVRAQLNLAAAEENVAKTAQAAAAALSNVGQGAHIKEVKDQVETLAKGLNDIVNEMKSIGNIGGGNLVKNVSKADEKTTQIAQALTKAMQGLAAGKEGAAGKEKDLAASTRDVNDALRAEKDLVEDTAKSMNTAANAITAAAIAAKSLAVVMGGNSGDVNKFIELATRLETLNNQAKLTMQAPNMTFDAKTQSLVKTREEIESVRNEMDELKKNAAVGNPLIDSFTTAFDSLNKALSSSGNLLKTAAGNMGELNANIGSVISKGNIGGTVAAQEQETQAVKETTKAVKEEEQASKQLVQSEQKVADAQKNTAQSAHEVIAALKEKGDAEKKLVSIEQKGTGQGNLFDTQKFKSLQEAIDKIVSEINRLKEAFEGIGNMEGLSNLATKIKSLYLNVNDIVDLMGKWSGALKLNMSAEEITAYEKKINELKTVYDELSQKVASIVQKTNEATAAQQKSSKGAKEAIDEEAASVDKARKAHDDFNTILNRSESLLARIANISANGSSLNIDTTVINKARESVASFVELLYELRKTDNISSEVLTNLRSSFASLVSTYKDVISEADKFNRKQEAVLKKASSTADNLGSHIENLVAKKLNFVGMDTTELDAAINKIRLIKRELENFANTGSSSYGNTAKDIVKNMGLAEANEQARIALQNLNKEKRNATSASDQLTESEKRLANAIKESTNSMKGQSQVLSDLKMMATQYLSVWGAQSFVNSIIETGGLLEQQRLSIGAILGDMEQATTLFGNIKSLALKSPFGVVELDKMSKQLTAYGFEYKELFDWTKRLADISAATGTEVSRLSLALGHVRSEGALSGYTLRQFAMANVPVLRMLSENLGISSKEVRERVRKKEISYDDVKDVLKHLTDEGGMFYNAQEVMSQALNAKFKNLRDAFDIMYNEIAEGGVGDALKRLAEILTAGAKHWERLGSTVLEVGVGFGILKLATLAYNTALGSATANTLKSAIATKQKEVANLELTASYRQLTTEELRYMANSGKLNAQNIAALLTTEKLTYAELERAVALGKVDKATAMTALRTAGMTKQMEMLKAIEPLKGMARMWAVINYNIKLASLAVKSFMASVWPLLALSAVFELVNRTKEQNEKAEEASVSAAKATNKYSELQATTERLGSSQGKTTEQLEEGIKEMENALIAVGEYNEELKKQVSDVETLAEKYEVLKKAMKGVSDAASDKQDRKQALINEGLSAGGGSAWLPWNWFRDNALRDTKDIDDYASDLYLVLDKNQRVLENGLRKYLESVKKWKKEYESMSVKDIFMALSENEQNEALYDMRWGKTAKGNKQLEFAAMEVANILYGDSTKERKNASGYSYVGALEELKGHKDEIIEKFVSAFNVDYPKIDLSKADDEQKKTFARWLDTTIDNLEDVKDAGKKALNDIIIEGTIKVRPKYQLDNQNFVDFMAEFAESNPLAYEEWTRHGRDVNASEEEQRKSAESYKSTLGSSTTSTIGNDAKKRIKELDKEERNLKAFKDSIIYKDSKEEQEKTDKRLKEIAEDKKRLKQAQKDTNQYGDPDKNKGEDRNAKAVRERVRVIKEAADAYQYWREKVGDDAAWAHVESEFGDVLKKIGITAKNIQDVRKHLNNIPNTDAYKAIRDQKVKTEVDKEIAKENDQYTRKDFEKQTEEFLSRTKIELDNLTRSWEMFNSVRDATGDVNIAVRFSGAAYALGNAQNVADALKNQIERDFQSVGAVPIPFNAELSERDIKKQIEEQFKQYEPTKNAGESDEDYNKRLLEYQSHIKSVVEEYTKWADLQRKVQDNAVTAYVKMISDSESLKTKLAGINDEYRKQIENLNILKNLGKISPEEYSKGVSHAENTRNLGMLSSLTNEVDWSTNDEFFGRIFREAGKQLEEQLNKFIGSKEYNALDVTQQQQYLNIRDQLFKTGISGSNPLNPDTWKDLANKTKGVQNAFKELMKSTLEYNAAVKAEENARKAAADGKGTPAEGMLQDKLKEATNNRVAAENNVSENQKKLKKATQDQNQASQSAAKGLQDFGNAIKGITSGSLSELTLGIGNVIRMFSKTKDAASSLSELLSGLGPTGGMIAAAIQLLDMLKDKSAETIKTLLDGMFDAITSIIKDFLTGKLTEAIIESAVEGVGKIVSEVIANIPNMIGGGIFSGEGVIVNGVTGLVKGLGAGFGNAIEGLFGFDANNSNENEVRESIDRLTKENERLTTVIDEATKELKESNGMKAINAAKEARDAQQQKNQNILEKWKNAMGYHAAHHSNASSWDLEDYTQTDVNNALREYSKKTGKKLKQINVDNWEEFMTLTPEEMNYIRTHAQGAWEDITTEGKYEWAHDFLNEYADQAGKLEEISEELKEKLTLLTLDGLHDSFLNELMDMDKSAKDFANDFKKYLMKAILNAQIADLLRTQLEEWRDAMAKYMEEDGGTLSPAHIAELQKMWDDIVAQGLKIRDETAKATGYTGDSTSGLSSNIKNVSEQTADILASYVNAIRADVAVDRHLAEQYFPMFHQSLTKGNSFLQSIVSHTSAIKASSEAIKDSTQAILDRLNGLKSGTWQVPVA